MASTYVNDLRLNEMATGDASGTWGEVTNTNLELIAEAFSYGTEAITTNADTHTTTIADGATDPGRSMYLKYTGTLDSACTITIGPNTVSKMWFIENATSGSQNIIISQGSGANITIPPGDVKVVYSDGAGSGAAVVDAFASLSVVDLKVQDDLTVTDDASVGGDLTVTGSITGTLATAAQPNITSVGTLTGLTTTGDINFGDNDKAIFGADSDLKMYHSGTTGTIENYTGTFLISNSSDDFDVIIQSDNGSGGLADYFRADGSAGSAILYNYGNAKLATTSTGIDVTGTVVADGLLFNDQNREITFSAGNSSVNVISVKDTSGAGNSSGEIVFRGVSSDQAQNIEFWTGTSPGSENINKRMEITYQGDISFYNSTATSQALFWDASAESLGIGTTSPSEALEVDGNIQIKYAGVNVDPDGARYLYFNNTDTTLVAGQPLGGISFINNDATSTAGEAAYIKAYATTNTGSTELRFGTGTQNSPSEAMRIDSSGNLLVGKTGTAFGTAGVEASASNGLWSTRSSLPPLALNRLSSDGSIADFYKDGTTVGSIGSTSGVVTHIVLDPRSSLKGAGIVGGSIDASEGIINPVDKTGAIADGAINLGGSSSRWKDLYLSGTANVGGLVKGMTHIELLNNGGSDGSATSPRLFSPASGTLAFSANGSERMRIDSSGNVGIGTTSPQAELHIEAEPDTAATGPVIRLARNDVYTSPNDSIGMIEFHTNDADSARVGAYIQATNQETYGRLSDLRFGVTQSNNAAATEAMRIDSSGNVGIKNNFPSDYNAAASDLVVGSGSGDAGMTIVGSTVSNGSIAFADGGTGATHTRGLITYDHSNDHMHFNTAGAERMRINSAGQVSIGTTSGLANLTIGGDSNSARVLPATDNVGYIGESVHRWQAIYAVTGSIQTSDEREKTEIKETTLGLDFIKDLKPVSYKWIDGEQQNKGKDEREHQGLIAQQVAETVEKHGIDKNTFGGLDIQKTEKYDDFHGMSYDQFVAPLIKAIQEQQAQIEALQSEINELKNS